MASNEGLSMSLDDMIAKRQEGMKKDAAPKSASGGGKEKRSAPPPERKGIRTSSGHDDRTSRPAGTGAHPRKTVEVRGIGGMTWQTLKEVFIQGGLKVERADVRDGLGSVVFSTYEDAEKAVAEYDRALVDGKEIRVKRVEGRENRDDAGPRQRGVDSGSSIVVKKPSSKLAIENLPLDLKDDELTGIFRECGRILDSKCARGRGYVTFQSLDSAKQAIREYNGAEVNGRVIEVSYAK